MCLETEVFLGFISQEMRCLELPPVAISMSYSKMITNYILVELFSVLTLQIGIFYSTSPPSMH